MIEGRGGGGGGNKQSCPGNVDKASGLIDWLCPRSQALLCEKSTRCIPNKNPWIIDRCGCQQGTSYSTWQSKKTHSNGILQISFAMGTCRALHLSTSFYHSSFHSIDQDEPIKRRMRQTTKSKTYFVLMPSLVLMKMLNFDTKIYSLFVIPPWRMRVM